MKRKVITRLVKSDGHANLLATRLSEEGANGWRFNSASTGMTTGQNDFNSNFHCIVLEESSSCYEYVCGFHRRQHSGMGSEIIQSMETEINDLIAEHEKKGFDLVQILQGSILTIDKRNSGVTQPRYNYLLIFEKSL